jgi:hypothetical protein
MDKNVSPANLTQKDTPGAVVPFQSGFDKQILGKKAESIYQNQIA